MDIGRVNPANRLEDQGIEGLRNVYYNLLEPALIEEAIKRDEGTLGKGGAFYCTTGAHTGRSPKDKFVVRTPGVEDTIWWENNQPMEPEAFDRLHADMLAHLKGRDMFVEDLYGGADPAHRLDVRLVAELAWHGLFMRTMLRRPKRAELDSFSPEWTIINCPSFKADPARHGCRSETVIALNFDQKIILIGNTAYAGENKKGVFSLLNYILPGKGVMAMHCSANHAIGDPDDAAVFFGLSGTGKTTLSADASRTLIGDDEHGWGEEGVFNFEGGCYAKVIKLSREAEPEIYATTERFGTVLENVVMNKQSRELDLDDARHTENTRSSYPIEFIPNASAIGTGGHPKNIVMLTCDAFGVLPPISKLSAAQAMYHFLSGYTAKVAGTEKGVKEPTAAFSACFGAPFMPRHPSVYAKLLGELIEKHGADCWLVNTGWSGGGYGEGSRMKIGYTRALLNAALNGELANVPFATDPFFGLAYPTECGDVPANVLNPRESWSNKGAYDKAAANLTGLFEKNFAQFEEHVDADVKEIAIRNSAEVKAAE
jgi:phosphoenolpyruvate carboxykinase (ATP)